MAKLHNLNQPESIVKSTLMDSDYKLFLGKVEFVDYEQKKLSIRDLARNILYQYVDLFPSSGSSSTSTEEFSPEKGTYCVCGNIAQGSGFVKIIVIAWITSGIESGLKFQAIRTKALPKGLNKRSRGVYRKVYPGQKVTNTTEGFSEKLDSGWDRTSSDYSQDILDSISRERLESTGTHVKLDYSGVQISGEVVRPGASNIKEVVLPDGSTRQVLFLKNNSSYDRYETGSYNSIPIVERLSRIQEFGLDYPVPVEIVREPELDEILGTTTTPFDKTKLVTLTNNQKVDDQTQIIDQQVDHPYDVDETPVGFSKNDAISYRRKGYILEKSEGTLVGYNLWDTSTYGSILKTSIFPSTRDGRFSSSTESGHTPVTRSTDEAESLLAATAMMMRFPSEYNTTRLEVSKEGLVYLELGSTIPKENISIDNSTYEHPHGAGRSLEMHSTGSAKVVIGKNRDEEESLDLTTMGQVVMRLGADDSSLPDERRLVLTQIRGQKDAVQKRTFQFWKTSRLKPGDAGALNNKSGAENVSLRAAFDGGTIMRLGARNPASKRKHLYNGYADAQGTRQYGVSDPNRLDSRSDGRPTYGSGDAVYMFHDLTTAGKSVLNLPPYFYSGQAITNMDAHGLSLDVHTVRDILIRAGVNPGSGNSLLLDLGGGLTACIGKDNLGRSITASLDGGAEITIGSNSSGRALQIEFNGDVNAVCKGNWHQKVTGDYYLEATNIFTTAMINQTHKGVNIRNGAMVQFVAEAPDVVMNQGAYKS